MPTVLTDVRSTANIAQIRRTPDLAKDIELIKSADTPYLSLLRKLRRKPVVDSKVQWQEDEFVPVKDQIDGGGFVAATTVLTVDNGAYFRTGDIVMFTATGETARVTATTATTITVTRSWGATAAADASVADNAEILVLGPAIAEGGSSPPIRSTVTANVFNFIQDFRTHYGLTDELSGDVDLLTENDMQFQRTKGLKSHLRKLERSLFFGEKNEDTSVGAAPIRSMGGMKEFIVTNVKDAGGTMTEDEFNDFLEAVFEVATDEDAQGEKWVFAAPKVMSVISKFARGRLEHRTIDKLSGMAIFDYQTPHGMVHLILNKLFAESVEFAKYAFVIDLDLVWLRVMRDTHRRVGIQANDVTTEEEEHRTKMSLEVRQEAVHELIKGVTG